MFRQASKNHRNKGFKVKHALQICLLLGVCIWLLYQVKHSHDKKKAFEENNAKSSERVEIRKDILKLGRKDLHRGGETVSVRDKHNEEEKEDSKQEESEGKMRGGGDDAIDEHEQEKAEQETENHEDVAEGEERENENKEEKEENEGIKESEEMEENEGNKEKEKKEENEIEKQERKQNEENKEKDDQTEVGKAENLDHDGDQNSNEAREAHYNGDNASSAVARETQLTTSGAGHAVSRSLDEEQFVDVEKNELENRNKTNVTEDQNSFTNIEATEKGTIDKKISTNPQAVEEGTVDQKSSTKSGPSEEGTAAQKNSTNPEATDEATVDQKSYASPKATEETTVVQKSSASPEASKLPAVSGDSETVSNNAATKEKKVADVILTKSESESLSNSTMENESISNPSMEDSKSEKELQNNATPENTENPISFLQNETISSGTTQDQNATVATENSDQEKPNLQTVSTERTESVQESEDNTTSKLNTNTDGDIVHTEVTDPSSPLIVQEVKDALTDLGTLPTNDSEVKSTEEVAAE